MMIIDLRCRHCSNDRRQDSIGCVTTFSAVCVLERIFYTETKVGRYRPRIRDLGLPRIRFPHTTAKGRNIYIKSQVKTVADTLMQIMGDYRECLTDAIGYFRVRKLRLRLRWRGPRLKASGSDRTILPLIRATNHSP